MGAGDSHAAGLCLGLACGLSVYESVRLGNACAALSCTQHGADVAISLQDIQALIHNAMSTDKTHIDTETTHDALYGDAEAVPSDKQHTDTTSFDTQDTGTQTCAQHETLLASPGNTVQDTLLFPLVGRKLAQRRWPRLFDSFTLDLPEERMRTISERLKLSELQIYCYGLRHDLNLHIARAYIQKHPRATIVNIGAGLDNLFPDCDNGQITYVNLDFPQVMQARAQFYSPCERVIDIAMSALDFAWIDQVPFKEEDGILLLAAGVMYYQSVEDGSALIAELARRFPGGRFSFDHEHSRAMKQSNALIRKRGFDEAPMIFFVDALDDFLQMSPYISNLEAEYDFNCVTRPRFQELGFKMSAFTRFFLWWLKINKWMYQITLDFSHSDRR